MAPEQLKKLLDRVPFGSKELGPEYYKEELGEFFGDLYESTNIELKTEFELGLKLYRKDCYQEALPFFEESYKKKPTDDERLVINNIRGLCNYFLGNLDAAKEHFDYVIRYAESDGLKAIGLGNLGHIYSDRGFSNMALKYYTDAHSIFKAVGNRMEEANQLGNIGNVYTVKGELNRAMEYHNDALKIVKEIGHKLGEAQELGNIGLIYYAKGDLDSALKYCNVALKAVKRMGHRFGEANQLGVLGNIYADKGDLRKALKCHNEALKIDQKICNRIGEAQDMVNIGAVYISKGDSTKALKFHEDALGIFEDLGAKNFVKQTKKNIADIKAKK